MKLSDKKLVKLFYRVIRERLLQLAKSKTDNNVSANRLKIIDIQIAELKLLLKNYYGLKNQKESADGKS